jgi:lysophospholipase L1-like esterase
MIVVASLLVAVAVAVAVVVWWIERPPPDPLEPNPVSLPESTPRYLALGDSYSAGEGLRPFHTDTVDIDQRGDRCHRSDRAYPLQLIFDPSVTVEFRACSGAKVEHLYAAVQEHGNRPVFSGLQAAGHLGEDVGLVTLTMGGNDVAFSNALVFCAALQRRYCLDDPFQIAHQRFASVDAFADKALQDVAAVLPLAYDELRSDAPNARIIVVGYPNLFSEQPTRASRCALYTQLFGARERQDLNNLGLRLNRVIEQTAITAGLEFVDISHVFAGHETCSRDGAWLQFLGEDLRFQDGNFHPNRAGQRMIARTVACYLTITERPDLSTIEPTPTAPVPPANESTADLGRTISDETNGDLGDSVYDCAIGAETPDPLDRNNPPVAEAQPYPSNPDS